MDKPLDDDDDDEEKQNRGCLFEDMCDGALLPDAR
jgi:hypothetical protein